MAARVRKRLQWPILVGILLVVGICGFLIGSRRVFDPYGFLYDLGPRISAEERHDSGDSFIGTRSRYRTLVFPAGKAAAVIQAVGRRLKVDTEYRPPAPYAGSTYSHFFLDRSGSYVAVEVCGQPRKMVVVEGSVRWMTLGECAVWIDQPDTRPGFLERVLRFLNLGP